MGSQSKYGAKELMFVNLKPEEDDGQGGTAPTFTYGFGTNIKPGDRTELGQKTLDVASPPPGLIIGATAPKPMRASMRKSVGASSYYVSSFCDSTKRIELKNAGWTVTRSKRRARIINSSTALVQTVYVTVRGIKYAWHRNKATATNATEASLTALGHKAATQADINELVFGAEFPKPPKASRIIAGTGGDGPKKVTVFRDPDSTIPSGWNPAGNGRLIL